jgi:hypothetical protein
MIADPEVAGRSAVAPAVLEPQQRPLWREPFATAPAASCLLAVLLRWSGGRRGSLPGLSQGLPPTRDSWRGPYPSPPESSAATMAGWWIRSAWVM